MCRYIGRGRNLVFEQRVGEIQIIVDVSKSPGSHRNSLQILTTEFLRLQTEGKMNDLKRGRILACRTAG